MVFLAALASLLLPASAGANQALSAGLLFTKCPAHTVPWPASETKARAGTEPFECQPLAEAADEAYLYLLKNMFEFDRGANVHSLVGGIFNNTVEKALAARQQCAGMPACMTQPCEPVPRCDYGVSLRQVSLGCCCA